MLNGRPDRREEGDDVDRSDGEGGTDQRAQHVSIQQAALTNEQAAPLRRSRRARPKRRQEASERAAKFR